jgi:hypothetical protein
MTLTAMHTNARRDRCRNYRRHNGRGSSIAVENRRATNLDRLDGQDMDMAAPLADGFCGSRRALLFMDETVPEWPAGARLPRWD